MKRILPLLLILCLLFSVLPAQALAYIGDILPVDSGTVKQVTLSSGSLALQNDYLRVIARKDGTLSTAPAADTADPTDRQTPFCYFVTYRGYGYNKREISHPASLRLKSLTFVSRTPNGAAKAIRADYDLTVAFPQFTATGTTSVYYELVQLKENESSAGSWGVLVSVNNVKIDRETGELQETLDSDVDVWWGYTLKAYLPDTFSVTPGSTPAASHVVCRNLVGFHFHNDMPGGISHVLWGFHDLVQEESAIPTKPDQVDPTIYALRLAGDPPAPHSP